MRSQNIKYKISSGGVCLFMLLLVFAAVNPVAPFAYAEEPAAEYDNGVEGRNTEIADANDRVELYASTPSTVSISFSPASGSASLSPSTSAGASAQINVLATVSVNNSDGYSVYLKGNSTNLTGKNNSSSIIPGATTAKTYASMDVNTWGYNATEGTAVPANATYKAITVSTNGEKIAENTNRKIASDTKKIMLSFAAKINDTKPADIYQNTITLSVVSSPLQTTLSDIVNMQDIDSDICKASATYETKQLKDTRDGKYYWVTKLADGNCWMTQNLDLDLSTSTKLTSATSDVAADWTPGASTESSATSSTTSSDTTGQRSWSLGNYRITSPAAFSNCGSNKTSAADCASQFTAYNTPTTPNKDELAHYILGNHYQWNAATAGTGASITNSNASSSICPKAWKLPTTNADVAGSYLKLWTTSDIGADKAKAVASPYYFVNGGLVGSASKLFYLGGNDAYYWSSLTGSGASTAFNFYSGASYNGVNPNSSASRSLGMSVRCVAR